MTRINARWRVSFVSTNNEKLNEQSCQEPTPVSAQVFITYTYTGNAYSSGALGSTSFARSSLLYWMFTGWILIFTHVVCLVIYDIEYRYWICLLVLLFDYIINNISEVPLYINIYKHRRLGE